MKNEKGPSGVESPFLFIVRKSEDRKTGSLGYKSIIQKFFPSGKKS